MKLLTLFTSVALASWGAQAWSCLSDADAQGIADASVIFLSHQDIDLANRTAQALFADNIVEFGDSINSLRGDPLGTQVEDNKATYIEDTLSTPPIQQVNTLGIVHSCNQMVWFFEFIGIGPLRIRGFNLITVDSSNKIIEQRVEFNSLAWAINIGFNVTPPATGPFSQ